MNVEQKKAFKEIVNKVMSNQSGSFFINGAGGTGKTFLYRVILIAIRSKGIIALARAISGFAASLLSGGRTTHSRFKVLLDENDLKSCYIPKQMD